MTVPIPAAAVLDADPAGQLSCAFQLSVADRLFMLREIRDAELSAGRSIEVLFRLNWSPETRVASRPVILARGNAETVPGLVGSFGPGHLHLHTHPAGTPTVPSAADIEVATLLRGLGAATAICSADLEQRLLITEAPPPPPPRPYWRKAFRLGRRVFVVECVGAV